MIKIISAYKCTVCGSITECDVDEHVCSKSIEALKPSHNNARDKILLCGVPDPCSFKGLGNICRDKCACFAQRKTSPVA